LREVGGVIGVGVPLPANVFVDRLPVDFDQGLEGVAAFHWVVARGGEDGGSSCGREAHFGSDVGQDVILRAGF
jgi:hypothetical protein